MTIAPVVPTSGGLQPVDLRDIAISGGFWGRAQELNRASIMPYCYSALDREKWLQNFWDPESEHQGKVFADSEIYKLLEGLIWDAARDGFEGNRDLITRLVDAVENAQEADGYLNTYFGHGGREDRYTDLAWGHELYCAGHLLQAAVASLRTGIEAERLTRISTRLAEHICDQFGSGDTRIGGHPEIETALAELARVTGNRIFLNTAKRFVENRGRGELGDTMYKGPMYYQDDERVRDARVARGHAVRSLYLLAGALDVAVETNDEALLGAVQRQFDNAVARRTYLTGGMGSNHHGETFGDDFELPSARAYAETCAAVASVQLAWRLYLATGEARYPDLIERTLYNNVISGPSADGQRFFYVNTLRRSEPGREPVVGRPSLRRTDGMRAPWYTTSCCPSNIARLLASLGSYCAAVGDRSLTILQYFSGTIVANSGDGTIRVQVTTDYPNDGEIRIRVLEAPEAELEISLRVPAWSQSSTIAINGQTQDVEPGLRGIARRWQADDELVLRVQVDPRFTYPDPRIDDTRGCVAVESGPFVMCAESADNPGIDLGVVWVDDRLEPTVAAGAVCVSGVVAAPNDDASWPYANEPADMSTEAVELKLVPYFSWANRGSSTMRVWFPREAVMRAVIAD